MSQLKTRHYKKYLITLFLTLAALVLLFIPTSIFASEQTGESTILPDSPFYQAVTLGEWVRITTSFSTEGKFFTYLAISDHRLSEVELLSQKGEATLAAKQLNGYNQLIEQTTALERKLITSGNTKATETLKTALTNQHSKLTSLKKGFYSKGESKIFDQANLVNSWAEIEVKKAGSPLGERPITADQTKPKEFDDFELVIETIPDGSALKGGLLFTKNWVVKNTGKYTWKGYSLRFVKGVNLGSIDRQNFTDETPPSSIKTINLSLATPQAPGNYYSGWQIFNDKDVPIGKIIFANISVSQEAAKLGSANGWIKVPILMYHYIRTVDRNKDYLGFALSITPTAFDQEMKYLISSGYHSITLDDLYNAIVNGSPLPVKPIILTFDDGYRDFFTEAYPIMKRYNLMGVTYIVPGFIGNSAYMTWDQVREVHRGGMEIASHTMHHVNLAKSPLNVVEDELTQSKKTLESKIGNTVVHFCYPYGGFTDKVAGLVGKAGYLTATTTYDGALHNKSTLLSLRRVRISGGDTIGIFADKIK